jgi:very-short-patch-repair endonuclease
LKFRKQHAIGKYIVDFYCAEYNLIVEIDGDSHATDLGKQNDDVRTKYLESLGYKIVRYNNLDVIHNIDGVFQDLAKYVSSLRPPLAPPHEEGERKE